MSENLRKMIQRKELLCQETDEAERKADSILREVLRDGGLTTEEVYALMAY